MLFFMRMGRKWCAPFSRLRSTEISATAIIRNDSWRASERVTPSRKWDCCKWITVACQAMRLQAIQRQAMRLQAIQRQAMRRQAMQRQAMQRQAMRQQAMRRLAMLQPLPCRRHRWRDANRLLWAWEWMWISIHRLLITRKWWRRLPKWCSAKRMNWDCWCSKDRLEKDTTSFSDDTSWMDSPRGKFWRTRK